MKRTLIAIAAALGLAVALGTGWSLLPPAATAQGQVTERPLFDNEKVAVVEYVFPAGFRGDEHAAFANEFAYVLDGEFTVVTRGRGKRVVRPGEVEYASKGTIHTSLNETRKPARVLVVILKDR
ncbi:MAG: cupin domain-containing protein [Candidatus Rokubacteria bacterium]|nr:cupin domain-containing protein [Candidatus Rokubacteria bacterium]